MGSAIRVAIRTLDGNSEADAGGQIAPHTSGVDAEGVAMALVFVIEAHLSRGFPLCVGSVDQAATVAIPSSRTLTVAMPLPAASVAMPTG